MNKGYSSYGKMLRTKVVDPFKINNFFPEHFFRISYILSGKYNF